MPRRSAIETSQHATMSLLILLALLFLSINSADAQVDYFAIKSVKVSRIWGQVFDPSGEYVANASVSLLVKGEAKFSAAVDSQGRFEIEAPPGDYWIRARADGFAAATVVVHVRHGLSRILPSKATYMILGLGNYQPCPPGTTSKREFQKVVTEFKEKTREYATQK